MSAPHPLLVDPRELDWAIVECALAYPSGSEVECPTVELGFDALGEDVGLARLHELQISRRLEDDRAVVLIRVCGMYEIAGVDLEPLHGAARTLLRHHAHACAVVVVPAVRKPARHQVVGVEDD